MHVFAQADSAAPGVPDFTGYGMLGAFLVLVFLFLTISGYLLLKFWEHQKGMSEALKAAEKERQEGEQRRDVRVMEAVNALWDKMRVYLDSRDNDNRELYDRFAAVQQQTVHAISSLDAAIKVLERSQARLDSLVFRAPGSLPPPGEHYPFGGGSSPTERP
jgi:hypothetical protein